MGIVQIGKETAGSRGVGWERKAGTIVGFVLKRRSKEIADKICCRANRRKCGYRPVALSGGGCWAALLGPCGAAPLPAALGCWEMRGILCWCAPSLPPHSPVKPQPGFFWGPNCRVLGGRLVPGFALSDPRCVCLLTAFYTSKYGYKMCLRVYLNGDGTGRGTHLSLFFVVMKGPNDALLRWPFNQKVGLGWSPQHCLQPSAAPGLKASRPAGRVWGTARAAGQRAGESRAVLLPRGQPTSACCTACSWCLHSITHSDFSFWALQNA